MIDHYAMLDPRETCFGGNKQLSDLFRIPFFFFCFEIKESWKGGEKVNDISTFVYGDWYENVWVFWWAIKRYFELKSSIKIGNKNGKLKNLKIFFLVSIEETINEELVYFDYY